MIQVYTLVSVTFSNSFQIWHKKFLLPKNIVSNDKRVNSYCWKKSPMINELIFKGKWQKCNFFPVTQFSYIINNYQQHLYPVCQNLKRIQWSLQFNCLKISCSCQNATLISRKWGAVKQLGMALTLSWDKNWDSHSLVNGYPSFYPRISLIAPSPDSYFYGYNYVNEYVYIICTLHCFVSDVYVYFHLYIHVYEAMCIQEK